MNSQDVTSHVPEDDLEGVSRRDALKQGLTAVAAAGVVFSAPRIEGLAATEKYGSKFSKVKKRRRCHLPRVRFRCNNGRRRNSRNRYVAGGDREGSCNYKNGKGNWNDWNRWDLAPYVQSGEGTCEGEPFNFQWMELENYGYALPILFKFSDYRIANLRFNFVGANNCSVPAEVAGRWVDGKGDTSFALNYSTPWDAEGEREISVEASFTGTEDNDEYKDEYK